MSTTLRLMPSFAEKSNLIEHVPHYITQRELPEAVAGGTRPIGQVQSARCFCTPLLTLHRLGVFSTLGASLTTTNCLESLNALVGQPTAKVDRWHTFEQKQQWLAAALLDIDPRLRRIKGFQALPLLRQALLAERRGEGTMRGSHAA